MENSCQHKPIPMIFGGFIGLIAIFFIWTWLSSPLLVTVNGIGETTLNVVNSTLTFTVLGDGTDATAAIGNLKTKASTLRKILVDTGVSEANIFESQVTVIPASSIVAGVSGFRSTMSMGAKNIGADKIDSLISILYLNGASLVNQPEISTENQSQLEKTAYDMALKDAKKKAGEIAKANGKWITKSISISESTSPNTAVSNKTDSSGTSGVGKVVSLVSVTYKMW